MEREDKVRVLVEFSNIYFGRPITEGLAKRTYSDMQSLLALADLVQKTNLADIAIHLKGTVEISYNYKIEYYTDSLEQSLFDACFDFVCWYNKQKD